MSETPPPAPTRATREEQNALNEQVIAEFRANGGRVGGAYAEGPPMILLRTRGARSGIERVNPMRMFIWEDRQYVIGNNAAPPTHPDWYFNLVTHPDVIVEYGADVFEATAKPLEGDEDVRVRAIAYEALPRWKAMAERVERVIPIILLEPKGPVAAP